MKRKTKQLAVLTIGMALTGFGQPRIFFSDVESGPKSGGENGKGAFVTIYGEGFGASQGSSVVRIGTGQAAAYPVWNDKRVSFQLGPAATTGDIVVQTAAGRSNPVPFVVRGGTIYFVSPDGKDGNSGSFQSPWKTLVKARNSVKPGDIVYAMNGVAQNTDDGEGWSACLTIGDLSGKEGSPIAMVAYPGATATIGTDHGCPSAIRTKGYNESYWVFAGFVMRGQAVLAIAKGSNWRVVGNDMSCPDGDGPSACVVVSDNSHWKFLGNHVHDTGKPNASALYHGVYFSSDSNHVEVGWNTIANVHGCRGLQFHSSPQQGGGPKDPTGHNQYDISIHDNVIHDTQCDGIILATVDPSRGPVQVYNNVIYNAGKGPNNPERTGMWNCIYVPGSTNTGPPGGGTIEVVNNTLYNCGTFSNPPYSGSRSAIMNAGGNPNLNIHIRNNIIVQPSGVPYIVECAGKEHFWDRAGCKAIYGSNNVFYGNGAAPSDPNIVSSVNKDPLFVNPAGADFHLRPDSPARQAGITDEIPKLDKDGLPRSGKGAADAGAYQFAQAVNHQ